MLKTIKVELDILAEKDHLDIVRRGIRGGMCGVYHSRFFKANNEFCEEYDSRKAKTWFFLLDANNLYGGVMRERLPYGAFSNVDAPIEEILTILAIQSGGSLLFLISNIQSNSITSTRTTLWHLNICKLPRKCYHLHKVRTSVNQLTHKLLQTFNTKKYYACHYRLPKFYDKHGLKFLKFSEQSSSCRAAG